MTTNPIAFEQQQKEKILNPIARDRVTQDLSENVILTTVDDLHNWARLSSLWPLMYGTACCFIEFAAMIGSRFDFDRYGLVPRMSPRQADLIIVAGTLTMKMAPALVRLYEEITGGMFSADSTTAVRGVDKLIPVDVYLPGCPPRPEAIMDAIIKLRKKISNESLQERSSIMQQTHRYYSTTHNMKAVSPILTGQYLQNQTRQAPPAELTEAMGMPVPPAMAASQKQMEKEEIERG
jgi:NAD(P)H-quinone oxidoreductase subunit K